MTAAGTLLTEGIKILCGGDEDIDSLIAPRRGEVTALLERYIKEIELFNPAYGLVGAADTSELVIKHILDSIAPAGIIKRLLERQNINDNENQTGVKYKIADIGSGAGLPGIPLAIIFNGCDFTLIERMGRRAGFLLNTQAALSLSGISIEECELERFADKMPDSSGFDLITFRAFKPLEPGLLKSLQKICAHSISCERRAIIAAYKGKREKIEEEMSALPQLKWEALPCPVPFLDEQRHLLVISG